MKINGKINRVIESGNHTIIEFETSRYQLDNLNALDKDTLYSVDIKEAKSKKSLNQNNYAWALITEIAKELDQFPDINDVYLTVLKLAKIKPQFYIIADYPPDKDGRTPLTVLESYFRVVRVLDNGISDKGVKTLTVECNEGLSSFNKDEMRDFIDKLLYFANANDIDTTNYERGLR